MTEIGLIPNIRAAQALVDYLKGQGIACILEPVADDILLSVIDEQHSELATLAYEHFMSNPNDPRYLQASWEHGDMRNRLDYGSSSKPILAQFLAGSGPLTLAIFISCTVIFALMNLGFANQVYSSLSYFGATGIEQSQQLWRIFTPSLLHFSFMHISFNLLWWWYFGGRIEKHLGVTPLLTLLVIAGTLPNIVQYYLAGPNFGGLSGVVYAIIAYVWVMNKRKPESGLTIPPALIGLTLVWMILGFSQLLPMPVANGAHLAGFMIGVLQGWFDSRKQHGNLG
ncbi:MAG: rhomboid family intramembrane serine protease GlpG [Parashewanella sp.]